VTCAGRWQGKNAADRRDPEAVKVVATSYFAERGHGRGQREQIDQQPQNNLE